MKKEIKKINNEIESEKRKINKLRQSTFNTKIKELKIESNLLEKEINKIKTLLENALQIKGKNDKKENEIQSFRDNIAKQDKILKDLVNITKKLENEKNELNSRYDKKQNELNIKIKKLNNNNSKLNQLKKKNENLTKQKEINNIDYVVKIKGNPIMISSLYENKISKLKKSINFYKRQIQYSDMEINTLKDKRKKLIDTEKLKAIKLSRKI
jgi:chromosome segregation protein